MKKTILVFLLSAFFVSSALAQPIDPFTQQPGDQPPIVFYNYGGAINIVARAANWLLYTVVALAIIFIVYAGFLYLTSGGNDEKIVVARKYITYAIVGVVIALVARGIVMLVQTFIRF